MWGPGRGGGCAGTGWAGTFWPALRAGLPRGPRLPLAPPPCHGSSGSLKGHTHRESSEKGELEGRSHIYHHVTARHNTCAHVRELYLPRAPHGRPGTRAAAGEEARQNPGGVRGTAAWPPRGCLTPTRSGGPRGAGVSPAATDRAECGASVSGRTDGRRALTGGGPGPGLVCSPCHRRGPVS